MHICIYKTKRKKKNRHAFIDSSKASKEWSCVMCHKYSAICKSEPEREENKTEGCCWYETRRMSRHHFGRSLYVSNKACCQFTLCSTMYFSLSESMMCSVRAALFVGHGHSKFDLLHPPVHTHYTNLLLVHKDIKQLFNRQVPPFFITFLLIIYGNL